MRLWRALLVSVLLAWAFPAQAQYTQAQLQALINTNLPTTGSGYISAALLRSTLNAMASSWVYSPTTTFAATQLTLSGSITGSSNTAPLTYGTLSYSDTNTFSVFQTGVNSYAQSIWQNTNNGTLASTDLIVSNNLGTATTYYGDFGINSSGFTGTGSLNLPNAVYLYSVSGDLSLGTTTANAVHLLANGPTYNADAITISSSNLVTINGAATHTGQLISTFGTPTIASGACGAGTNGTITGTNQSGIVTIGAAATSTCAISFSTTITAPNACVIFPGNAAAAAQGTTLARVGTPTATSWTITGSALASTVYSYICL